MWLSEEVIYYQNFQSSLLGGFAVAPTQKVTTGNGQLTSR